MRIILAKHILEENRQTAEQLRRCFLEARLTALNLLGSPGAGKTTLLEALLPVLPAQTNAAVIEGDLETDRDAARIADLDLPTVQINTQGACHLDAAMVGASLDGLDLEGLDLLVIENVGNLVCTAGFDLGEHLRVVVLSVTEGHDKVRKYPAIFRGADAVFLNKIDLLEHTDFDVPAFEADLARIAPSAVLIPVSARTGAGVNDCLEWIMERHANRLRPAH